MSGADDEDGPEWQWAHIMWQKHGLRMEEWAEMPRAVQLAYIASEQLEVERPTSSINRLANVYIKTKK